ncbi:2-oxo-tetronate isomerase [Acetobacter oeni]|uniref:Hydroxypyruvate isomerase n=1 Tax=Acetobacter oeni TaxID=304077 RepID=A0A511XKS7_9PROT|nr:2-oxo-tetronate isomerase [Acetobacter oeni]MBB3883798.1 hydroxypyruvate isomerase [Acetobacter oeni]NHO19859.1 TIM barrel protein [Acetobacter oeni]GBR10438.1 hydroxypyruvate isomerase [Acetobacter oeni LMG 21952]GEN63552.1 hydroxypyruvate isomerase [Acetobacter oeni]
MPAFAANLTMLYTEMKFPDRFSAAAKDGFRGVEFLFPYDYPADEIALRLKDNGLRQALFNAPPGDWSGGERGIASLPGREDEFRRSIDLALTYAERLGNRRLHVMAGLCPDEAEKEARLALYTRNIAAAAAQARSMGVTIVLEAINTRDMPGYLVSRQEETAAVCRNIGADNVRIQFDFYHAQIMQGDLTRRLERLLPLTGHVQIAGVPERHEPDSGEIAYDSLYDLLDRSGYEGWVGCEYHPRATASEGLGWMAPWESRIAVRP